MSKHPEPPLQDPRIREDLGCKSVRDLLESYVDGELGDSTRLRLRNHLADCQPCGHELILATRIRDGLARLPQPLCPPTVSATVFAKTLDRRGLGGRIREWFAPIPALRPALALILLASLGAALWLANQQRSSAGTTAIADPRTATVGTTSAQEVQQAEADIKLALAYLGKISQKAGDRVTHGVLGHPSLAPIARTLGPMLSKPEKANGRAG